MEGDYPGLRRVVIEGVYPEIDCGRFPIKRSIGEPVRVEADIFAEGHDVVDGVLLFRHESEQQWRETPMTFLVNDRWFGFFTVTEMGIYLYTLLAWVDRFQTWRKNLRKKVDAEQDVSTELLIGAQLIEETGGRAGPGTARDRLQEWAEGLRSGLSLPKRMHLALEEELAALMVRHPDRTHAAQYHRELAVTVDRKKARFSTWYEMFPRSTAEKPGRHGTFQDCERFLPYVADMGFDVLYFPPVHPIGRSHRKGRNNAPVADSGEPGSPWAIGGPEGGHKAIHPQLGTLEDLRRLVEKASDYGLEIAMDLAFQCAPDHPYVKEHPEWFKRRPDGTIQYAENPPKKYQDIYPIDFETESWWELWQELKDVVLFWIDQGIRIFRVDNPHTKPFRFWEWLIGEVKKQYAETLFLSEAFTRPKVMNHLAKLGFTQSYTYFTWRNTSWELRQYFTELFQTEVREFLRPNLWPNTPDILTEYLQMGARPAFMARLVLAATLGASYGIYGPAFELCENRPREFGSEEYLNSEKYEIRDWERHRPDSLKEFIARVNRARSDNPALQNDRNLLFHSVDNDQLLCYSKHTDDLSNIILVVVNLDPHHRHSGWLEIPLQTFGLDPLHPYQVHDLLSNARFLWYGSRNYVELDPQSVSAHVFRVRRKVRTERDFDYFM